MDVESRPGGIFAPTQTDAHYLHQSGVSIYNADKRSRNDVCFTIAYVLLAAVTVGWGIAVFVNADTDSAFYTNGFYSNSTSCDIQQYRAAHPNLTDDDLHEDATFTKSFNKAVSIWLPISAGLAVFFSVAYLLLFRRFAKAMVILSLVLSVALTLGLGIVCFLQGAHFMGVILVVFAVLGALFYWFIRRNLQLCAELLALSARALYENVALVPAALLIKLAGAAVLLYGFAAFISAFQVGSAKRNPAVLDFPPASNEDAVCYDDFGVRVNCCVFETKLWATAYAVVCAVFISWTVMLTLEIKLYTVADTLSQWYFSAPAPGSGSAALGGSGGVSNLARGSVRLALKHCLTTSFGSVAFASAILAAINFVRRMLSQAARNNIICCIINCVAQPILALMEKFTRFATIATAITGQAFVPSARVVYDTLKRNFLQTYSMWWVPDRVLGFTVFLLSLSWGGIVVGATYGMTKNKDENTQWGVPIVVGILAFILMAYLLSFVSGLLLDAVNTLYICYALDKDQRRVTHPEVHSMFAQIPGLAVENPDGNVMYGAPDANQYQQPQQQYQYQQPQQQSPYVGVYQGQPVAYPAPAGYNTYLPVQQQQETRI
ncbi:hypothetical protein PLESTB_001794700 [Pleodorina starrii]|uniref:Choline transporter-like protein n=1 Tax=Pleodorina starrii TaxID=330485 RepID=A0A9W6FAI1_9CHLO|nr:hypothetical protein PLESTM_001159000 [Pleodorina starrii]GLC61711.1 hypothetical protein PLESTB_001794700 [Pleodorina starrii]GLC69190.1 hypothetical protein PLESTF_000800300 [Pleodorina starrii]